MASDAKGSLTFEKLLDGEIIRIEVTHRSKRETFSVHRQLLAAKCPAILMLATKHPGIQMRMTTTRDIESFCLIHMPQTDIDVFELFLMWLYQGAIKFDETSPSASPTSKTIMDLIIFADRHDITNLADQAMDYLIHILRLGHQYLNPVGLAKIYKKLGVGCKLRIFIAKSLACHLKYEDPADGALKSNSKDVSNELVQSKDLCHEVLTILAQAGVPYLRDPAHAATCEYHGHALDEDCPLRSDTRPTKKERKSEI